MPRKRSALPRHDADASNLQRMLKRECAQFRTLAEVEADYIDEVMRHTRGNILHATDILGIDRRTVYRKLAVLGIEPNSYRVEQPPIIPDPEYVPLPPSAELLEHLQQGIDDAREGRVVDRGSLAEDVLPST